MVQGGHRGCSRRLRLPGQGWRQARRHGRTACGLPPRSRLLQLPALRTTSGELFAFQAGQIIIFSPEHATSSPHHTSIQLYEPRKSCDPSITGWLSSTNPLMSLEQRSTQPSQKVENLQTTFCASRRQHRAADSDSAGSSASRCTAEISTALSWPCPSSSMSSIHWPRLALHGGLGEKVVCFTIEAGMMHQHGPSLDISRVEEPLAHALQSLMPMQEATHRAAGGC